MVRPDPDPALSRLRCDPHGPLRAVRRRRTRRRAALGSLDARGRISRRLARIGDETVDCASAAFERIRVGRIVRMRFGRFERNLEVLQIRESPNVPENQGDS